MDTREIRDEVARLENLLGSLEVDRKKVEAKLLPVREELGYWSGILKLRSEDSQSQPLTTVVQPVLSRVVDQVQVAEENSGYGAKARALRTFIKTKNGTGTSMKELVEESKRLGSHPNMAYRFVDRLTKTNPPELEKKEDRFFTTQHFKG